MRFEIPAKLLGCSLSLLLLSGCGETNAPVDATASSGAVGPGAGASSAECEGAIAPTKETIESGEYKPLSRPLFIYVNKAALKKPEVAGFVKTMFGAAQDRTEKSGFIKLKPELLAEQQAKLDAELKGVTIPEKLESGSVAVNGSSTVFPFAAVAANLFEDAHDKKVSVTIGKKGTGGGFEKFCAGETDINNASRVIKDAEIEKCKAKGVEYIELAVCIDGISVCVNPKNTWCNCLSIEQLKALFEPGSKVHMWKDLNPAWPDKKIGLYSPDTDSGTFEYFTEVVVGKAKSSRQDYTQSSEDTVLVKGIAGDEYGLGYFGYSYYDKNRKTLKALAIKPAAKKAEKSEEKKAETTEEKK